jgi:hypothetical protein
LADGALDASNELHDSHALQQNRPGVYHPWANTDAEKVFKVGAIGACHNKDWEQCEIHLFKILEMDLVQQTVLAHWLHPTMTGNQTWREAKWDGAYHRCVS